MLKNIFNKAKAYYRIVVLISSVFGYFKSYRQAFQEVGVNAVKIFLPIDLVFQHGFQYTQLPVGFIAYPGCPEVMRFKGSDSRNCFLLRNHRSWD